MKILLSLAALLVLPLASAGPLTDVGHTVQGLTDPVAECIGSGECARPPCIECLEDEAAQAADDAAEAVVLVVCGPFGCASFIENTTTPIVESVGGPVNDTLAIAIGTANDTIDPGAAYALLNDTTNGAYAKATGLVADAYDTVFSVPGTVDSKVPYYYFVSCKSLGLSWGLGCSIWMHRYPLPFS